MCDCGCNETIIKNYHHEYILHNQKIEFDSKRKFCKNCNKLIYDADLDNKASKEAIKIYNQKYGIPKEAIIELRKKYSLSQEAFAKIIGCAKKTLISYELGNSIPNDIYMVTLKMLINDPEILYYLIEDNKDRFNDKEYEKILNKVYNYVGCNISRIKNPFNNKPTEYNGYTDLNLDKLKNLILILSKSSISKTKMNKELFYIDFLCYSKFAYSLTGLTYSKLKYGPVPDDYEKILNNYSSNNVIDYQIIYHNETEKHLISAKDKVNYEVFSKQELEIIKFVQNKFKNYTVEQIVEFSHKEKAFLETKLYKSISYEYALDLNI